MWRAIGLAAFYTLIFALSDPMPITRHRSISAFDRYVELRGQKVLLNDLEADPTLELQPGPAVKTPIHGCVHGTMRVNSGIGLHDQVGIFKAPGRSYPVEVRFSDGDWLPVVEGEATSPGDAGSPGDAASLSRDDSAPSVRELAILVQGVDGARSGTTTTQSFVFYSLDRWISNNAKNWIALQAAARRRPGSLIQSLQSEIMRLIGVGEPRVAWRVFKALVQVKGPQQTELLGMRYWSVLPHQHGVGRQAPVVKYSIAPCAMEWGSEIEPGDKRYLRHNLQKYIAKASACFKLSIQDWHPRFSVEDATRPWSEEISPFREIAEIDFDPQPLMDDRTCQALAIHHGDTLPEHRPLGELSRLLY